MSGNITDNVLPERGFKVGVSVVSKHKAEYSIKEIASAVAMMSSPSASAGSDGAEAFEVSRADLLSAWPVKLQIEIQIRCVL